MPDYDYSGAGEYFITMCIQNRECLLGKVENETMQLNHCGFIVNDQWKDLPNHYPELQLGAWMVMPNHFHGILILTGVGAIQESPKYDAKVNQVRAIQEPPQQSPQQWEPAKRDERRKMLLSKIIGRFKMTTAKQINLLRNTPGTTIWQRNYYEHIIRNNESFTNIENYILNNPASWNTDTENPGNDSGRGNLSRGDS